jgi:predicted N-formylglutamate amidohydrolase
MLAVVLSCEHASFYIPDQLAELFAPYNDIIETHEGWDPGALEVAQLFSKKLNAPLYASSVNRLVVDLNRDRILHKPFSKITQSLTNEEKAELLTHYYYPYRRIVAEEVEKLLESYRPVIHLSVHSFTPVLNGQTRTADIGFLYDPRRSEEKKFTSLWKTALFTQDNKLKVRLNYPYKGVTDGFTRYLRARFPNDLYLGIELEINQKFLEEANKLAELGEDLVKSFQIALQEFAAVLPQF